MKRILFVLAIALFSIDASSQVFKPERRKLEKTATTQSQTIELYINGRGKIYVNNKKTSVKKLEEILTQLEANNGVVKFARDNSSTKATEKSREVSKLISKYKRRVEYFTDKTFSKQITW